LRGQVFTDPSRTAPAEPQRPAGVTAPRPLIRLLETGHGSAAILDPARGLSRQASGERQQAIGLAHRRLVAAALCRGDGAARVLGCQVVAEEDVGPREEEVVVASEGVILKSFHTLALAKQDRAGLLDAPQRQQ